MKIVHVVPHISDEASGPSYCVPRLCQSLAARGHEVELSCLAAGGSIDGVRLDVHPQWPVLSRFAISPAHARALRRTAGEVDIVHNNSLWSMVNVATGWVVPGRRAHLVTSPHGTLAAWALAHKSRQKAALWLLQRRALSRASLLHATSEGELEEIRQAGLRAPVVIAANGIDLPRARAEERAPKSPRTLLFVSRIHEKKGIDRLLHAWAQLAPRHPGWELRIVGKGEAAYEAEVRQLAAALELPRVAFPGPVYGAEKARAYDEADLFVLPTHSENFAMVVAEALAAGCPAVVSTGAPWSGLRGEGCGWWVDNSVETLVATLDQAMSLPPEALAEMGARGRRWMARDFGWDGIAAQMEAAYGWLMTGGSPPPGVWVD